MRLTALALPFILLLPLPVLADESCQVVAVTSGSSLDCRSDDGRTLRVELRGIGLAEDDHAIAEQARLSLQRLTLDHGATLRGPRPLAPDRIGAAVWVTPPDCPSCGHTLDVGRALLSVGLARWRPDAAQGEEERAQYSFEEQEARARKVGLWHPSP